MSFTPWTLSLALCRTVNEVLPPPLDSSSEPPPVFDGTTRLVLVCFTFLHLFIYRSDHVVLHSVIIPIYCLFQCPYETNCTLRFIKILFCESDCIFIHWRLYISYTCPYAQRVWITRNCKVGFKIVHNPGAPCFMCVCVCKSRHGF